MGDTKAGPIVDGVQRSADWPQSMQYLMEYQIAGEDLVGGYESAKQAADHAEAIGATVSKIVRLNDWAHRFVAAQPKQVPNA
jgi:hypothetical protein